MTDPANTLKRDSGYQIAVLNEVVPEIARLSQLIDSKDTQVDSVAATGQAYNLRSRKFEREVHHMREELRKRDEKILAITKERDAAFKMAPSMTIAHAQKEIVQEANEERGRGSAAASTLRVMSTVVR